MNEELELNVCRKQTVAFIQQNPTNITFSRPTRMSNGKGGWTTTPVPVAVQELRMILASQGSAIASRNIDGEEVQPAFVLIGRWDADVSGNDTFMHDSRSYSVMYVRGAGNPTAYETWVEVRYVG